MKSREEDRSSSGLPSASRKKTSSKKRAAVHEPIRNKATSTIESSSKRESKRNKLKKRAKKNVTELYHVQTNEQP